MISTNYGSGVCFRLYTNNDGENIESTLTCLGAADGGPGRVESIAARVGEGMMVWKDRTTFIN